jgi:MFS family permease
MSPQRLIMLAFFLQPVAFGSWLPRIPDLQARLGLGPGELAFTLLGLPIGIGLTLPLAGPLVARIGSHNAIRYAFLAYLVAVCLPVFAFHPIVLFAALLLTGISISSLELGLNVAADEIERTSGRPIMSTCHGCWSLGIAGGNLVGAWLASTGLPPQLSVPLIALACLPFAIFLGRALPPTSARTPAPAPKPGGVRLFLPSIVLIGICYFALGTTLTEGAAADWSAIYLRQIFGSDPGSAGIGYGAFALMVAGGRLVGDRLRVAFGPVAIARATVAAALVGVTLLYLSPSYAVSLVGFALAGIGVSVSFPLAVTAAAGLGDRPPAQNVAVLSLIGLSGFLFGPPIIGFVAQHWGLRIGLAILLPGLLMSLLLAGLLRRPAASPGTEPLAALPAGDGK